MELISFYTSWKHEKNRFFDIFRGYRKKPMVWNGLVRRNNKWSYFASGLSLYDHFVSCYAHNIYRVFIVILRLENYVILHLKSCSPNSSQAIGMQPSNKSMFMHLAWCYGRYAGDALIFTRKVGTVSRQLPQFFSYMLPKLLNEFNFERTSIVKYLIHFKQSFSQYFCQLNIFFVNKATSYQDKINELEIFKDLSHVFIKILFDSLYKIIQRHLAISLLRWTN